MPIVDISRRTQSNLDSLPLEPINTIVIGNNREYFSSIDPFVPAAAKDEFVQSDYDEADMDLFWEGDNKVIVLPPGIDLEFAEDVCLLMGYKNVHLLEVPEVTRSLCKDLASDPDAFNSLRAMRMGASLRIIPWGHTREFEWLRAALAAANVLGTFPETPLLSASWVPDYFDTKVGSRRLIAMAQKRHSRILLPQGVICENIEDALASAESLFADYRGVVFKANLGGAGIGVIVCPPSLYHTYLGEPFQRLSREMRDNLLFGAGPIIVEEYIAAAASHGRAYPSVDAIVGTTGEVRLRQVDSMVIHTSGKEVSFYGCQLGRGLFTEEQSAELASQARAVGEELSELGYRGWYDVDFIMTEDETFYVTEANLRRTSICYMLELAHRLFGEDFSNHMAMVSNDKFISSNLAGTSYSHLKSFLSPLLFPIGDLRRGIIITQSVRTMFGRGKFGYVSIGSDYEDACRIEEQLVNMLDTI